jgi:hypothetical protein
MTMTLVRSAELRKLLGQVFKVIPQIKMDIKI